MVPSFLYFVISVVVVPSFLYLLFLLQWSQVFCICYFCCSGPEFSIFVGDLSMDVTDQDLQVGIAHIGVRRPRMFQKSVSRQVKN